MEDGMIKMMAVEQFMTAVELFIAGFSFCVDLPEWNMTVTLSKDDLDGLPTPEREERCKYHVSGHNYSSGLVTFISRAPFKYTGREEVVYLDLDGSVEPKHWCVVTIEDLGVSNGSGPHGIMFYLYAKAPKKGFQLRIMTPYTDVERKREQAGFYSRIFEAKWGAAIPSAIWTRSKDAQLQLSVDLDINFYLKVMFFPAPSSEPQLEVEKSSNGLSGHIQSPLFDVISPYTVSINSLITLTSPLGPRSLAIISIPHMDLPESCYPFRDYDDQPWPHDPQFASSGDLPTTDSLDRVDTIYIYRGKKPTWNRRTTRFCSNRRIPPYPERLNKAGQLKVLFRSDKNISPHTGFRMLFSMHALREAGRKYNYVTGKWRCDNASFWASISHHFLCNLVAECVGGEDERNCSYTTDRCGHGLLDSGISCYKYVAHKTHLRWRNAASLCIRHGGQLASLNTWKEWDSVTSLLRFQDNERTYVGLQPTSRLLPNHYAVTWQWLDGTVATYVKLRITDAHSTSCGSLKRRLDRWAIVDMEDCMESWMARVLCEMDSSDKERTAENGQPSNMEIALNLTGHFQVAYDNATSDTATVLHTSHNDLHLLTSLNVTGQRHVMCPLGHVTHAFMACDVKAACWAQTTSSCDVALTPLPPQFTCTVGVQSVPYSLVCDYRHDCSDGSDEDFCQYPACSGYSSPICANKQCVTMEQWCDHVDDCNDHSDEVNCYVGREQSSRPGKTTVYKKTLKPPARVWYPYQGTMWVIPLCRKEEHCDSESPCPETHFRCSEDGYCYPVFVRCNGVFDCPDHGDEKGCQEYTCPGFYRCRDSTVCVHPTDLCDKNRNNHCPQQDDDLLCDLLCPQQCVCYGAAFFCAANASYEDIPELRFLEAPSTSTRLRDVRNNTLLIHLVLSRCDLTDLDVVSLPNLRHLDLSYNQLHTVNARQLENFKALKFLSLSGNPFVLPVFINTTTFTLMPLQELHMTHVRMLSVDFDSFPIFPNLQVLNMSHSRLDSVTGNGLRAFPHLRDLDLEGCPLIHFPRNLLKDLLHLETVRSMNYKMCCPRTLPEGFNFIHCHAPYDVISSCDDLLKSPVYRSLLAVLAILALLGNLGCFLYRVVLQRNRSTSGFSVFVLHLSVSDFLMGVYLAVLGLADLTFRNRYLWREMSWRNSGTCSLTGFLSLLSSELSAVIVCLITLDRFMVLKFPFGKIRFRYRSAHLACGLGWGVGVILAAVPLLPMTSHWQFYSQTGICIPLPITGKSFPGHAYSFAIMIVLNFVLFILIAAGQVFIYWTTRSNSLPTVDNTKTSKDMTIARRLLTVAMTDFCCWFPIGLAAILATCDVAVPSEVNVAMAVLVLPLNSAINPFIYTVNMILERQKLAKELRLRQFLSAQLKASMEQKKS